MLRSFDFILLADALAIGAPAVLKHLVRRGKRHVVLRLLLARPLWWMAVRLLTTPDPRARYEQFSTRVLAKWEDFLLGDDENGL